MPVHPGPVPALLPALGRRVAALIITCLRWTSSTAARSPFPVRGEGAELARRKGSMGSGGSGGGMWPE